jgi:arabinogalactan endo-1,4-beta-galactosidase
VTTGNGSFYWENANLAVDNPTTTMAYGRTYHRGNWTIYHDANGARFTNDVTGHGMFVSIENVYAF